MSGANTVGGYRLVKRLGRGGMAEVFEVEAATGPRAGQRFALKRLLPELQNDPTHVKMFASEVELSRGLHHPNIVRVHEIGEFRGNYFIVMELIDGRDAGQIVRRCKERNIPWPIDFAVYLTKVLLDALAYAHTVKNSAGKVSGIIHCDISPSNLFISRTGDIKLGDFGVARAFVDRTSKDVMGKPYYLSPETLAGRISPSTDLWAAGVTLFELLTLERPFNGNTADEVFAAVQAGDRPSLKKLRPEIPLTVSGVIDRAFAPDESDRFADAEAMAAALKPLYDENVGTPLAISAIVRGLFPA